MFLSILASTPIWVYFIFVYLIIKGISASKSQIIPLQRMLIVPIVFLVWSLYSLNGKYGLSGTVLGLLVLSLGVGALIGWSFCSKGIKIESKKLLIEIPGSWYPMILYMLFFILKYILGFTYAVRPELRINPLFWGIDSFASGIITGIFLGRLIHIMKLVRQK